MSSDFSSAVQKLSKRKNQISSLFFFLSFFFFFSNEANSRTIRRAWTEKVPKCFSLLRGAVVVSKCQAMNKKKKVENHAYVLGWPLPPLSSLQTYSRTTTRRGINKVPNCFSCPGDCKELSKKTKRSTYDSNQARTKPWPTRSPTSDKNSPITKRIRTNEAQKCFSNLGDCSGLSKEARRWNSRNQGSSQLTVWQWLTRTRT